MSDYGIEAYRGWFWAQAVAGGVGFAAASKLGPTLEHRPAWHGVNGWLTERRG